MKKFSLTALALGTMISVPALAADLPVRGPVYKAPPAPPPFSWSGCYLGGQVGVAWQRDSDVERVTATGAPSAFTPLRDADDTGGKIGGFLGCNWQWSGPFVVGIEGDAEAARINGTAAFNSIPADFYDVRTRFEGSVRGRIGYAMDRSLLYITGGFAAADIRHTYRDFPGGNVESFSKTQSGWTIGAGWDYAFTDNWFGRAEYRYADFGRETNASVVAFPGFTERHRTTENVLRFGIGYKFGGPISARY